MINFNQITNDITSALKEVLIAEAKDIAEQSQKQVPKETGELKNNCTISVESDLSVTVGYDLPYAVIQHENLESRHQKGNAKFLEKPFLAKQSDILLLAADAVKRVIK